jgi:hypothetical protein
MHAFVLQCMYTECTVPSEVKTNKRKKEALYFNTKGNFFLILSIDPAAYVYVWLTKW